MTPTGSSNSVSAPARLHARAARGTTIAVDALQEELRAIDGEVRFDAGSRALYATDGSNYRQVPIGVVVPRSVNDAIATVAACRRHGAPLLARGAGTSLAGQCCNAAVVMDMSKYLHHVRHVDVGRRRAYVQPGVPLDALRSAAAPHGLTFGPDPATHQYCTLGGMIGNNSCGIHSVLADLYGPGPTTAHNVESLDVVTYRGVRLRVGATGEDDYRRVTAAGGPIAEIYERLNSFRVRYADLIRHEFPDIPRRVSGYNLPALLPENGFHVARALVGSECTLAVVLEAEVHLVPAMNERVLVVLGYPDVFAAAAAVPSIMEHHPVGLEGMDRKLADDMRRANVHAGDIEMLPEGDGWLLVEFGADTSDEVQERAELFVSELREDPDPPSIHIYREKEKQERIWTIRESGLAATAHVSGQEPTWPGWEDSSVPPDKLSGYLRDLDGLFKKHGYDADLYGHFGQGCVHCRIDFDLMSAAGITQFRSFVDDAAELVHRYGGSLSGEHGDGQARGPLLSKMFSGEMLQAFREFKSIWDPDWKLNPGKVIDANPVDANLRLGAGYNPPALTTHFQFPEDRFNFAHATLRCVGVGKCRKEEAGTMCPSYMATREEKHTTRGRARLLFEMLEGDPLTDGWASDAVHEALDLCLACKGCKGECPVHVDMATYKAEFLSHYYEHHRRSRHAYAFGWIRQWAALGSRVPRLVNTVARMPLLSNLAKYAAGMSQHRRIPAFAPVTFREWFLYRRLPSAHGGERVILWPDTFTNFFHPEIGIAATSVLERAGFRVEIPRAPLCCGRPLYDFGMLDAAKERLRHVMRSLEREIVAGVPIVGLEPSCVSVFRDELTNLFPHEQQARRLARQFASFGEFLTDHHEQLPPMHFDKHVLFHGHCHQKALIGTDADTALLERAGCHTDRTDSGCCGMAGSFGFEAGHFDVSMAIGEQRLLPRVRALARDRVVIADGFSCREQIAQSTERRALHVAEVLDLAIRAADGDRLPEQVEAECRPDHDCNRFEVRELVGSALVLAGAAMAAALGRR